MDNILRIGDTVWHRAGFGRDLAREDVVEGIELVEEGSKYGEAVESAPWSRLHGRHAVISFGNHWAYAEQISPLRGQEQGRRVTDGNRIILNQTARIPSVDNGT